MSRLLFLCFAFLWSACGAIAAAAARPPNIIHIVADDLGYDDIGPYGAKDIPTPNLDRLARQGMRFTQFYAPGASCTPTRAALLTGCYAPRVGLPGVLFPYSTTGLHESERTIGHVLKAAGYATAVIGKWHLGHQREFLPHRRGFDRFFGIPYPNDHEPVRVGWAKQGGQHDWRPPPLPLYEGDEVIEAPAELERLPHRFTVEAIRFITQNRDRPFFLHLANIETHTPYFVGARFQGITSAGAYADAVNSLDWTVGEIEAALQHLGLTENTLVVFTSDNGPIRATNPELTPIYGRYAEVDSARGHALRGGKGSAWEGGVRVPCLAKWPGRIPAGTVCHELAAGMDLFTTFAQVAGAALPSDRTLDGVDLSPLFFATPGSKPPRDTLLYHRGYELAAIRDARWKLVFAADHSPAAPRPLPPPQLYDLQDDLAETTDLATAHPEIVARLQALAAAAREDIGDALAANSGSGRRPPGRAAPSPR